MSQFFDKFIQMFEAMGPSPVQYGRNGVLQFGRCGERAEWEQNQALAASDERGSIISSSAQDADFNAPLLSNEQRPISSCGHGAQRYAATPQLPGFETPAGHRAPEPSESSGASGLSADLAQMPDTTASRAGTGKEHPATNREVAGLGELQSAENPEVSLRTEPELTGQEHGDLPEHSLIADRRQVAMASANAADRPMKPGNEREIRQDRFCAEVVKRGSDGRLDAVAGRVLAVHRVIDRMSLCPQGADCLGDGKHMRVFECEQGCGFVGCCMCIARHEEECHWTDAMTAREMERSR